MKPILYFILTFSIFGCGDNPSNCTFDKVDFYGKYDIDSMKINCNGNYFVFETTETVFDTIKGFDIKIKNKKLSPYCTKLTTKNQEKFLLTMERPDFAGPCINLIDLNQNEPKQTLSIQREPIEIFSDKKGKSFIVLQLISSEPGFQDGYDIVSIPLFELCELKSGEIELDAIATEKYNLENFDDFERIQKMNSPVYGFKTGQKELIEKNKN